MLLILASQPPKGVSVAASLAAVSPRGPSGARGPVLQMGRPRRESLDPASQPRARAASPGEGFWWRFPALPGLPFLSGSSAQGSLGQTGGPLSEVPPRCVPGRVTRPGWPSPDVRTLLCLLFLHLPLDVPLMPLGPSGVARVCGGQGHRQKSGDIGVFLASLPGEDMFGAEDDCWPGPRARTLDLSCLGRLSGVIRPPLAPRQWLSPSQARVRCASAHSMGFLSESSTDFLRDSGSLQPTPLDEHECP